MTGRELPVGQGAGLDAAKGNLRSRLGAFSRRLLADAFSEKHAPTPPLSHGGYWIHLLLSWTLLEAESEGAAHRTAAAVPSPALAEKPTKKTVGPPFGEGC